MYSHVFTNYLFNFHFKCLLLNVQGQPSGIDIMYLVLADRNMQVRFGLKVVWESRVGGI